MELNDKMAENPMLVGAIELMKADPSPEHKNMFVNEMMKAKLLTPAVIEPMPEPDENGERKLTRENEVRFPILTAGNGKKYFMAFSDRREAEKWNGGKETPLADAVTVTITMEEIMLMCLRRKGETADGCVINPYGGNILVPREMMEQVMAQRFVSGIKKVPSGAGMAPAGRTPAGTDKVPSGFGTVPPTAERKPEEK